MARKNLSFPKLVLSLFAKCPSKIFVFDRTLYDLIWIERIEPIQVRPPLPRANSIPTWVKPEPEPAKPPGMGLRRIPSEGNPTVKSPGLKSDVPPRPHPSPIKLPAADDSSLERMRAETVTTRVRSGVTHEAKGTSRPEPIKPPAAPELPADNWQIRLEQEAESNRELIEAAQEVALQQVTLGFLSSLLSVKDSHATKWM